MDVSITPCVTILPIQLLLPLEGVLDLQVVSCPEACRLLLKAMG